MKKDKLIEILFEALVILHKEACEYEQDNTPKLSRALNKAQQALNIKAETPTA